ncbi:hypothetical protein [Roseovarius sp. 217]|uniref:hypothetical protein n=1 Tax=Roseovarius sp. (strain 217) TaxID=314264 RepID=UPI0000684FB6|nr:hypothetical protein [Roseovarius sp. 217]EAQ23732.1 hypothetical protein ROS217_00110 [Roseovarius sp. 217]
MQVEISHKELSGLIGLIYESALEDPQWKRFLDRMGQLYPGIGALVYGHEGERMFPAYVQTQDFLSDEAEVDVFTPDKQSALTATLRAPNAV